MGGGRGGDVDRPSLADEASVFVSFEDPDSDAEALPCESTSGAVHLKPELRHALERPPRQRSDDETDLLFKNIFAPSRDPFLLELEPAVKRAMCSRMVLEEYSTGERIMEYGGPGDKVFYIYRGTVQIDVPAERLRQQLGAAEADERRVLGVAVVAGIEMAFFKFLEAGRVVGERSLTTPDSRRSASVTAVEDCLLISVARQDYNYALTCSTDHTKEERVAFLASLDRASLAGVDEADIQAMAGRMEENRYSGEQVIVQQGADVDRVVFVKSGFCKVVRELHPRYRAAFEQHADRAPPLPNPLALDDAPAELSEGTATGTSAPMHSDASSAASSAQLEGLTFREKLAKLIPTGCSGGSGVALDDAGGSQRGAMSQSSSSGGCRGRLSSEAKDFSTFSQLPDSGLIVHVDQLGAGRSFGMTEMFEGLPYQCSLVASPWAVVDVISKYDLIRNTPKSILHRFFTEYKMRVSDERLLQRLMQKNKWNNYKQGLLEEIRRRKNRDKFSAIDRRAPVPQRAGLGTLAAEDFDRIGRGDTLWNGRAKTPPMPTHADRGGQDILHIKAIMKEDGHRDVDVARERRQASMVALDERIIMMTSKARQRDRTRRQRRNASKETGGQAALSDEVVWAAGAATSPDPDEAEGPVAEPRGLGCGGGQVLDAAAGGGGAAAASGRREQAVDAGTAVGERRRRPCLDRGARSSGESRFTAAAAAAAAPKTPRQQRAIRHDRQASRPEDVAPLSPTQAAPPLPTFRLNSKSSAVQAPAAAASTPRSRLLENPDATRGLKTARSTALRSVGFQQILSAR